MTATCSSRPCFRPAKNCRFRGSGVRINDNTVRPPSVLVGQLCDHLAAGWQLAGHPAEEGALLRALTIEHRLQPFNSTIFQPMRQPAHCSTYAHEWRMADDRPASGAHRLDPVGRGEPLRIAELAAFLRDPVKAFFRQRLRVDFDIDNPASEDQEPFDLDGLQKWSLWNELIARQAEALHAGQPREDAL